MPSVIDLYDKLSNAPDDRTRARIIAEAFEMFEDRYPRLADVATQSDLRETELRLLKEIEKIRLETTEVKLTLTKEIESVRMNIETVRAELGKDIEKSRANILLWTFAFWATQLAAIFVLIWRITATS